MQAATHTQGQEWAGQHSQKLFGGVEAGQRGGEGLQIIGDGGFTLPLATITPQQRQQKPICSTPVLGQESLIHLDNALQLVA